MATLYPGAIDGTAQIPTTNSGTNTLSLPTNIDHTLQTNNANGAIIALENTVGTTQGTNVLANFAAGQFPVRATGGGATGTLVQTLVNGTYNNATYGTPTLQAPTINGQGTNSGTVGLGVYGSATYQGGTALGLTIGTPIASGIYSNGNISTGTTTITWTNGDRQCGTMTGNGTLKFAGTAPGQILTFVFYQNATGGYTCVFPTMKWPGTSAGTIGTAASSIHTLTVLCDQNSNFLAQLSANYG